MRRDLIRVRLGGDFVGAYSLTPSAYCSPLSIGHQESQRIRQQVITRVCQCAHELGHSMITLV
jgi:hypothetical protein